MSYKRKAKNNSKKTRTKRKSGRGSKRRRQKAALSKREASAVVKIVNQKLDAAIEDKYILDATYSNHISEYDSGTKTILFNVSPYIEKGDAINNRQGNKVRLKYLRTFFRYLPQRMHHQYVVDGVPSYVANWFPDLPPVRVYLVRLNNELAAGISDSDLRIALNAKFRIPGKCWQDYAQSGGKKAVSGVQLMDKFTLPAKWRQVNTSMTPINGGGTLSSSDFTLTPTYQTNAIITHIPQMSNHNMYCSKVAQKVEIGNVDNEPLKYQYWFFAQFDSGFNDTTYNPIESPELFEIRNVWVYEDA